MVELYISYVIPTASLRGWGLGGGRSRELLAGWSGGGGWAGRGGVDRVGRVGAGLLGSGWGGGVGWGGEVGVGGGWAPGWEWWCDCSCGAGDGF